MVRPPEGGFPPPFTFIARRRVLPTRTLAWMLDSLVRVTRRAAYGHYASALRPEGRRSSVSTGRVFATGCKLPPEGGSPSRRLSTTVETGAGLPDDETT